MNHEIITEKIVQSLSLEVEPVQNDSLFQLTSTSRRTPLKVKVKVRKKDKADTYYGYKYVPNSDLASTTVDKIHLVNSDQTIMSFDMLLDTDQALPTKKTRNKLFSFLRPGICLGNAHDEKESYQPSKSRNTSIASKSDGMLKKHLALSKKDYLDLSTAESIQYQNFLGKCKPGGCLDPPFSEDKYSYAPVKQKLAATAFTSKNLHLRDDIRISKQDSVIRPLSKEKLPSNDAAVKNIEKQPRTNSILNLYQAESINTSLSITYSNSIITYPPPLTPTEVRLNNEKNIKYRISTDNRSKKSFNEFSQAYFISPKEIMHNFSHRDSDQDIVPSRDDENNNTFQGIVYRKNETVSNIQNIGNVCQGVTRIISDAILKTRKYEESSYTDLKSDPVIDNNINSDEPVQNYKPKETLFDKRDSKNESPYETTAVSKTHDLQYHEITLKSKSNTIKSIDTLFMPSIRTSLAETNLNLYTTFPEQLAQKENVILSKTLDTSPLYLEENTKTVDKRSSTSVITKCDSKNPIDSSELPDSTALGEENIVLNQDHMVHKSNVDLNNLNIIKPKLKTDIDFEVNHALEVTQDAMNAEKKHYISNIGVSTDSNTNMALLESTYNENDNVQDKSTKASPIQFENKSLSELKNQQLTQLVKNVNDNLAPNSKEMIKYEINNTSSGGEFGKEGGYEKENMLINDVIIYPNMDTAKPESYKMITQSDTSKDRILNKDLSQCFDNVYNQNDEKDSTSSNKSKLASNSSLGSENNVLISIENDMDRTSLPTTHSPLRRLSKVLLTDQKAQLENDKPINFDQYESEDPVIKISQTIPDLKEALEDVVRISSAQMTEHAFTTFSPFLQQNKDFSDIQASPFHDSLTHQNQETVSLSIEKDISLSKESGIKEDVVPLAEISENLKFQTLDPNSGSAKLEENLYDIDSTMIEVSNDEAQQLLHEVENQLSNVKEFVNDQLQHLLHYIDKQLNKYNSVIDKSAIRLFEGESKPSEETVTMELGSNTNDNSKNIPNIDTKSNEEILSKPIASHLPYLDRIHNNARNILETIDNQDTRKERITDSETVLVKLIDESLLGHDSRKTDQIKTADLSDIKPINSLNNVIIRDAVDSLISSQKILNETTMDNLITTITSEFSERKFGKSMKLEKQLETISLQSPVLIDKTMDNISNKNDEYYFKSSKIEKQSAIFDVVAFPNPKKLKEDIATLKHHSVLYTSSENTLTKVVNKDMTTLDLAFHVYVNEKNKKIVKTFDSEDKPQRYSDDRVIIIKSDLDLSNNEIKIPIDNEHNLFVLIKKSIEMDHTQKDAFKEVEKICLDREVDVRKTRKTNPNDFEIPNLHSIYETEILPLQNAIKDLKHEIDYLAGHSLISIKRDNLLTGKLKPVKLTDMNKRCVCLKRLL